MDAPPLEEEMEKPRERGRASLKKEVIVAATEGDAAAAHAPPLFFVGYLMEQEREFKSRLAEHVVDTGGECLSGLRRNEFTFYAEMGGQAGD